MSMTITPASPVQAPNLTERGQAAASPEEAARALNAVREQAGAPALESHRLTLERVQRLIADPLAKS
ncbi:hypothetical protein M7784_04945 [Desulfovibrio aminophilus]|nr:hypothetical protein [Desulfovibrio aminophilus]MCM0754590.1 hypothetical protein [Desulfovibrio aminophilus]